MRGGVRGREVRRMNEDKLKEAVVRLNRGLQ